MRVIAFITDATVVRTILVHPHLWRLVPTLAPARAPPSLSFDDAPSYDSYGVDPIYPDC